MTLHVKMIFRKATEKDIAEIAGIFEEIHDAQDRGDQFIGWERGVYPTEDSVRAAVERDDLYACVEGDRILAAGVINQIQVPDYYEVTWENDAPDEKVMVLHMLGVSPSCGKKGVGTAFVKFYEEQALLNDAPYLRMDTNERNVVARTMYKKLGYKEPGIIPTVFNGIPGVNLVMLEKKL